jgi:hypothetical protein
VGLCAWPPRRWDKRIAIASVISLLPSMLNIAFAAKLTFSRSGAMPLDQFVQIYVRLRHPHHYDPATWPLGLWLAFAWPTAVGLFLLRGQARRVFILLLIPVVIALIGAGLWFIDETLIQLTLYRFTIYLQLLGSVAAAIWITGRIGWRSAGWIGGSVCTAMIVACLIRGPFFGVFVMPGDDRAYIEFCQRVRQTTPEDAIFLVSPGEQSMRLVGRRAIVVNFKGVAELSAELIEWRQRLLDVLALDNLDSMPHDYRRIFPALRRRYDELTLEQHIATAKKYGARYIVYTDAPGHYCLYDLKS